MPITSLMYAKADTNAFLAWISIIREIQAGKAWEDFPITQRLLACSNAVLAEMIKYERMHELAAELHMPYDEYVRLESR